MAKKLVITEKLPKRFKRKWLEALRGGEYKKGKANLLQYNDEGDKEYCCLGVACAIVGIPDKKILLDGTINFSRKSKYRALIPKAILGLVADNPVVNKLVDMNDSGKTRGFGRIAIWIEKNL